MPQFNRRVSNKPLPSPPANDQLYAVPKPLRDPRIGLDESVGAAEVAAIARAGVMQFQATGDTGVGLNSSQPMVAEAMARDINTSTPTIFTGPMRLGYTRLPDLTESFWSFRATTMAKCAIPWIAPD